MPTHLPCLEASFGSTFSSIESGRCLESRLQSAQGAGVGAVIDVGGAVLALFVDGSYKSSVRTIVDLDVNSGGRGELLDDRAYEVFFSTGVNDEFSGVILTFIYCGGLRGAWLRCLRRSGFGATCQS